MNMDEWKSLQNRLVEAWEHFVHTLQQAADALAKIFDGLEKRKQADTKPNPYFNNQCRKKSQYLRNAKMTYRMEKKPQKNLPYQRRNY